MKRAVWIGIILIALLIPVSAQAADEVIMTPVPIGLPAEEPVGVWVGGVDVSAGEYWINDGSGSITREGATQENYNVFYDSENMTLYLRDAKIQMEGTEYLKGIAFNGYLQDTTIQLQGKNEISLLVPKQADRIETVVMENGEEVKVDYNPGNEVTHGIYAEYSGNLLICGPGSLDISLSSADEAYGIMLQGGKLQIREASVSMRNERTNLGSAMVSANSLHMNEAEVSGESFQRIIKDFFFNEVSLSDSRMRVSNAERPLAWDRLDPAQPIRGMLRLENSELHIENTVQGLRVGNLESQRSVIFVQSENDGIETVENVRLYGGRIQINAGSHAVYAHGSITIDNGAQVNVCGGESGLYAGNSIALEKGTLQAEGGQYAVWIKRQVFGSLSGVPEEAMKLIFSEDCLLDAGTWRVLGQWVYRAAIPQGYVHETELWEREMWLADVQSGECGKIVLQQEKNWKIGAGSRNSEWLDIGLAALGLLLAGGVIVLACWGRKAEER